MWAGSRLRFHRPLVVGSHVTRTSQILDVALKDGRSGQLVFVRIRHELEDERGPVLSEVQDIVYREAASFPFAPATAPLAPTESEWHRKFAPDPVVLFRYSADMFNGHRIHYDRSYATQQEGYPALVVHGPLTATLLVDLLHRSLPAETLSSFSFKAVNPVFDNESIYLHASRVSDSREIRLWAANPAGVLCVEATATLAPLTIRPPGEMAN
jgi:3-methylfumaryl-CoA hydratase